MKLFCSPIALFCIYISDAKCNIHNGTEVVFCLVCSTNIDTEAVFTETEMNNE